MMTYTEGFKSNMIRKMACPMENNKLTVFALTFLAFTTLSGCGGPNWISVKPSTDSLGSLEHSATGTVHISTSATGLEVVAFAEVPGSTILSPPMTKLYVTKDDVVSIVNTSSIEAIRQAGYNVTTGAVQAPNEKADFNVDIKVKSVVGTSKRNHFTRSNMEDIAGGDRGKREDNILSGTFNNTYSGAAVAVVTFTNNKTNATFAHVVSGADYSGLYTNDSCVEHAITGALQKYKINLVKALEAFQQGLLK